MYIYLHVYILHRINGIPACANKELLTDILRNEWNFKGYVVSDQGALGELFFLSGSMSVWLSLLCIPLSVSISFSNMIILCLCLPSFPLPLSLPFMPPISLSLSSVENIYTQHHYTDGLLNASIAAASAGTCLEDGNADDKAGNVFANLGDAVGKVCAMCMCHF